MNNKDVCSVDAFRIPSSFWKGLTDKESSIVFSTGLIKGKSLMKLCKMVGWKGKKPKAIQPLISREWLESNWPMKDKK